MSTDIDWDALITFADQSNNKVHFGSWAGRIGYDRWCAIRPFDPDRGWSGEMKVEQLSDGQQITVELFRPLHSIEARYTSLVPPEVPAEHLARTWAVEIANMYAEHYNPTP